MSDNENTSTYQEKIAEFNIDGMNVLPDKNYKALSQVTIPPATIFLEMLQGTHSQLTDDDILSSVDEVTLGPVCSSFTSIDISKPKKVILKAQLAIVETLNVHDAILEIQHNNAFAKNEILTEISGKALLLSNSSIFNATSGYVSRIRTIPPVINNSLPQSAFNGAQKLTAVSIENATNIPDYCFYLCRDLRTINFKKGITERIGTNAFHDCHSLIIDNFVIPEGVTEIGKGAFSGCRQIKNFTFPESLINIRAEAFYGCASITEIFIPDKIVTIPEKCFSGCTNLTNISFPSNINSYGSNVFNSCSSLTTITVRGNSSCATAQALQTLGPNNYNNATIVYTES